MSPATMRTSATVSGPTPKASTSWGAHPAVSRARTASWSVISAFKCCKRSAIRLTWALALTRRLVTGSFWWNLLIGIIAALLLAWLALVIVLAIARPRGERCGAATVSGARQHRPATVVHALLHLGREVREREEGVRVGDVAEVSGDVT